MRVRGRILLTTVTVAFCESCHSEFRERIDGGFRIKPGI